MYIHTQIGTHTYKHTRVYIYIYTHTYIHISREIYDFMCIYICIYIYIYNVSTLRPSMESCYAGFWRKELSGAAPYDQSPY